MKIQDEPIFSEMIKRTFDEYEYMVKHKFPKLNIDNYYKTSELYVGGIKDECFPYLKLTTMERAGEIYFKLVTFDGIKRTYKEANDLLNNIEKDIKYFFIKKNTYKIHDLMDK